MGQPGKAVLGAHRPECSSRFCQRKHVVSVTRGKSTWLGEDEEMTPPSYTVPTTQQPHFILEPLPFLSLLYTTKFYFTSRLDQKGHVSPKSCPSDPLHTRHNLDETKANQEVSRDLFNASLVNTKMQETEICRINQILEATITTNNPHFVFLTDHQRSEATRLSEGI